MKKNNFILIIVICAASMLFLSGCSHEKNPLKNTMWRFAYSGEDYTIFSFSEFYFAVTDYRILNNGKSDYYEVTGIYEIKNGFLRLEGETGKMVVDGDVIASSFLKSGWDGEYEFTLFQNELVLKKENASVTLLRARY